MRTMIGEGFSLAGKYKPFNSCPSLAVKEISTGSGGRTTSGVSEGTAEGVGGAGVAGCGESVRARVFVGDRGLEVGIASGWTPLLSPAGVQAVSTASRMRNQE
jgi:hypothetical protein